MPQWARMEVWGRNMTDSEKLYDIIKDAIDSLGNYSYSELIGILEIVKAEVIEEYFEVLDELRDGNADN